jgi:hypothetical protein
MKHYVMLVIAALALLFLTPLTSAAQTTQTLAWDYVAVPVATVQTYQQSATVDGAPITSSIVCAPSVSVPTTTTCKVPLVPPLSAGPHTMAVTAVSNGVEKLESVVIDPSKGPTTLSNPRVTVTVIVTVP